MRRVAPALLVTVLLALTGCGSDGAATSAPSVDTTATQLQDRLDALPQIDGAHRTAHDQTDSTLSESFTVPPGAPACLQLLSRLDAGGYEVVTGLAQQAVDPDTCRTADAAAGVDTDTGTGTILASGGSEIALTWTATTYTISVTAS